MSLTITSSENYTEFVLQFPNSLGHSEVSYGDRLFTCVCSVMKKTTRLLKDFPPGQEDVSPDIINLERVMSMHFFNGAHLVLRLN